MALKILIIQWIIMHCNLRSFLGMRWENKKKGIFSLYWKHQSSRICRENAAESESMYDYCIAWARHKNNNRCRQPRDLKAAFRNALEKKLELERLPELETKDRERIYWRIKDFSSIENKCSSKKTQFKKPKGPTNRERKSFNKPVQNGDEFPINYGASTSTASEDVVNFGASTSTAVNDVSNEQKKTRRPPIKGRRKATVKTEKSLYTEEVAPMPHESTGSVFPTLHDEVNALNSLPPFGSLKKSSNDDGFWGDSLNPTSSKISHDKPKDEDIWTPQLFISPVDRCTPPQLSSDLMDVSSTEMMDLLISNPSINYSFQPSPPQQTSDIIFDNFTGADLMNLDKILNGREPTILKYSFPFQPNEIPINQNHHQKIMYAHQIPATSSHCSVSDYTSPTKTFQRNNSVLDTRTTPVNAFLLDQKQCFYDQVVPEHIEAFHTNQQMVDTSAMYTSDCLLYSPSAIDNNGQMHAEMCHQQVNTSYPSVGLFRFDNQTSLDDSGISDMDDFLECANKLLDDIDSKSDDIVYP